MHPGNGVTEILHASLLLLTVGRRDASEPWVLRFESLIISKKLF